MIPTQATIYPIPPFDAQIGSTIKFTWSGNQAFKNRCIIKDNDTNEVVYDQTIDSFKYEHPIDLPKANLINGQKYNAFITIFDKDGDESSIQALGKHFLCLKTPSFSFSNAAEGQVISASAYDFALSYSQENGELLDSWSITLYSTAYTELASSGLIYQTDSLSYVFTGFTNKSQYLVRAVGRTVNGLNVDTGYINLSVTYSIRDVFSLLEPTNLPQNGCIQIRSNIVSAEGHPDKEPAFMNGEAVDLRNNAVWYTEGFEFRGDFSIALVFYMAKPNQTVLNLYAENKNELTISAAYRVGNWGTDTRRGCYELRIVSCGQVRVYYSNVLPLPADDDRIGICITRSNNDYNIEIVNLGKAGE